MKHSFFLAPGIMGVLMAFLLSSCSPVTLTSWKNPKVNQQVSSVVVWGMFDKLEYEKPFEYAMVQYFNQKGLKAIPALQIIDPKVKYAYEELEKKFAEAGADAALIFTYKGTEKDENYVPPTTTVYPDYYYNYYSYYNWAYPMYYSPGYNVVTTGGYWTTTTVVNLTANLYENDKDVMLWTASISITDPNYMDQSAIAIGKSIYQDWVKEGLVKFTKK